MMEIKRGDIVLRTVNEEDAAFIVSLRNDDRNRKFISPTSSDISSQIEWIKNYKKRELAGIEFYFIVTDPDGNKYGTTRLYNFDDESFEVGSWVFSPDAPAGMAIKADLYCREYGFSLKNMKYCRFEVRKLNKSVVKYHKGFSPVLIGEDDLNYYFKLDKINFDKHSVKLLNIL